MKTNLKIIIFGIVLGIMCPANVWAQTKSHDFDTIKKWAKWPLSDTTVHFNLGTGIISNDTVRFNGGETSYIYLSTEKCDTVPVLAYCCIDFEKPLLKWVKMYGIRSFMQMSINFNGLIIYQHYLMNDRKTHAIYRVIYSIDRPVYSKKPYHRKAKSHGGITSVTNHSRIPNKRK